ncbi:MAG: type II toxin-antitoxin system VapB family antitoxin [Planctomycetaceae bacterium]|jgi:Arc/MetJ family transcription regulator|nr:type II toxin-antitoxin system VapB family antitoxin [Planctomycetaceae bacterium]
MRITLELDGALVKKAMALTKISDKNALINKALDELIVSNFRREILKFADSGAWKKQLQKIKDEMK